MAGGQAESVTTKLPRPTMAPFIFLLATAWIAHVVPIIGCALRDEVLVAGSNLPLVCGASSATFVHSFDESVAYLAVS